jgi:cell division protein FtsQ
VSGSGNDRRHFSVSRIHTYRTLILFCISVFLVTMLIIGGILSWRWVEKPTSFPIRQVNIEGQLTHESSLAVQKIMKTGISGGFFSLNVSGVKQALLAFPWVASVSFRRVWPDTLDVKVTEQKAAARFGENGILNTTGDVFYPSIQTIPQNLPDLTGPVAQAKTLFDFYQTANTLAHVLGLSIVSLNLNAEQSWSLMLSNQIKVKLGGQEALSRFKRFIDSANSTQPATFDAPPVNTIPADIKSSKPLRRSSDNTSVNNSS